MKKGNTMIQKPNKTVVCDICHKNSFCQRTSLKKKEVVLEKEGIEPTEVVLTVLTCPHCGKYYTVKNFENGVNL